MKNATKTPWTTTPVRDELAEIARLLVAARDAEYDTNGQYALAMVAAIDDAEKRLQQLATGSAKGGAK